MPWQFFLFGKNSFESHENSYWFLKNSSQHLPFTIFLLKVNIYSNKLSIKKKTKILSVPNIFVSRIKAQTENNPWKIENLQKFLKCKKKLLNYLQKKCLVMRIGGKIHYLQPLTWFNDFFFGKTKFFQNFIKPTKIFFGQNKKIRVWYWMINQTAKFQGFWWTLVQFFRIAQRMTHKYFAYISIIIKQTFVKIWEFEVQ
jgi:hypothetical protein